MVRYLGKYDNSKVFKMDFKKKIFSKYEELVTEISWEENLGWREN